MGKWSSKEEWISKRTLLKDDQENMRSPHVSFREHNPHSHGKRLASSCGRWVGEFFRRGLGEGLQWLAGGGTSEGDGLRASDRCSTRSHLYCLCGEPHRSRQSPESPALKSGALIGWSGVPRVTLLPLLVYRYQILRFLTRHMMQTTHSIHCLKCASSAAVWHTYKDTKKQKYIQRYRDIARFYIIWL